MRPNFTSCFGPRLTNYLNCESASRLVASSVLSSKGDWEEKLENINHPLGNLSCFKLGPVGITAKLFMVQLFFSSATPNIKLCPGLDNTCVREYGTAVTKSTFSYILS